MCYIGVGIADFYTYAILSIMYGVYKCSKTEAAFSDLLYYEILYYTMLRICCFGYLADELEQQQYEKRHLFTNDSKVWRLLEDCLYRHSVT